MERIKTDVLVIGAGSGGLSVAAGAVQMGADVTLLEGDRMGGDCLNYGCVPSKTLIAAGKHAHAMTSGADYGITPVKPKIDYAAAKRRVHEVIETIAPIDSQERFERLGVRVIREYGRFVDRDTVETGEHRITARRIVVATGSSPLVPPIDGLEDVPYLTNETLFDLMEAPSHLVIVGGGPIGMEMAQAHVRLGCKVTVIEGARALGKDDPEMAEIVLRHLRAEGVDIVEGAQAKRVSGRAGAIVVHTDKGDHRCSHLLMAVGRRANIDRLDLDRAGIEHDRAIRVGPDLRTTNRRVYAVGDVAGGMQFTHVAGYHGSTVIRPILFGLPARVRTDHIPWVTYTDPELAQVGMTEAQARERHGKSLTVLQAGFDHNDRAVTEGRTDGRIKVMVVRGRPVGVSIAGPHAGELIGLWALLIAKRMKIGAVTSMVAPYPTLGEISKRVAGQYYTPRLFESDWVKRAVRLVQRRTR
ncbi:dihydrolipoyl dehydrogenase family protein [Jannaschia rubra]|uniref:Mercuric reductase n=1 Tax=Jannaschia rubra TaxID=282197 RepID=A0A0M6XSV7_9RHOB|nr:FAD-dependent oxidoreductase [Jannaschia rubra]CTQ33898.1 Mercuric reductase [Jannaschia rubra]SFG11952.1 Pyruvate/2-oxoglutarate dehydrogenase complex, dihydrolipoamide dehydrogenase (E3) component [Jannaschia rubra]